MKQSNTKPKILIIGAGPAGLTAGVELLRRNQNCDVLIIEKSKLVGGIARTVKIGENYLDPGGHRFFTSEKRVLDFWNSLLPENLLERNRISHIYYQNKFFSYPISLTPELFRDLGLKNSFEISASYLKSLFLRRPNLSLESFYINHFGEKLYDLFFKDYTAKLWGCPPSSILPDWGHERISKLSLKTILQSSVNHKQLRPFLYPPKGPGQLWQKAAEEFKNRGGKILYDSEVISLLKNKHQISSLKISQNGKTKTIPADIVISSMPLKDLILKLNEAPPVICHLARALPFRNFISVAILTKNLDSAGRLRMPDCWIYVQEPDLKLGRLQIYNNWSPSLLKNPQHTILFGAEYFCSENGTFWRKNDNEIISQAIAELVKIKILKEEDVLEAFCERTEKAYPGYFGSYQKIDQIINYLNQISNLYCIGRGGQHRYYNMDQASKTAFQAVDLILSHSPDKTSLWQINNNSPSLEDVREVA